MEQSMKMLKTKERKFSDDMGQIKLYYGTMRQSLTKNVGG
jgi:hypothetical protein